MECTRIEDDPDPEIIWPGVTAREKISVMWADESNQNLSILTTCEQATYHHRLCVWSNTA